MRTIYARFPGIREMGSRLGESGQRPPKQVSVQHGYLSSRRYASRTGRLSDISCIGWLLSYVSRTTSLLPCWLDAPKRRLDHLFFRRRAMRSGTYDVLPRVRSGIPLLLQRLRRRAGFRRTAVGLMPLGCTSNDW